MSWQVIWELVVGFVSSAVEKSLAVGGGMTHVEMASENRAAFAATTDPT